MQEPWVIQTVIEGYHIIFLSHPFPSPGNLLMSSEDSTILEEEIVSLLQK